MVGEVRLMTEKPESMDEYKDWASTNHRHDFGKSCATWYGAATQNLLQTLQDLFLTRLQVVIESGAAYRGQV
jgi:hypothetical protein